VGVAWQGQGIASEAARAVVRWLERRGVATITAHIHPDHHASAKVETREGLQPTGWIPGTTTVIGTVRGGSFAEQWQVVWQVH
jgi:RimJ/RimL family protein N-acetyltransferase